uniref:uncharacterized protein At4g00950-like n=1 Tax=Erigeron canadensis TaxID=72917 RepID=UPI001CB97979|nr:uncharacterized protein At4g00950-like [Erigeron canadensis]
MRSDAEPDPYSIPKLPLFSMSLPHISEPSGMLTPPLQTSASVPFQWEEQPGKPRPCTDLIIHPTITRPEKSLDLPPRLAMLESSKSCSPTTVLDGPGDLGGKSLFLSASCRFSKEKRRRWQRQRSFDSSSCSGGWSPNCNNNNNDETMLLGGKKNENHQRYGGNNKSLFGSFRLMGGVNKSKVNDDEKGNFVTSLDTNHHLVDNGGFEEKKMKKLKRNLSLSKVTRSHFWVAIYEGFKHVVVPWKKKPKKESVDSL